MTNLLTIRNATAGDIELLTHIGRQSFDETFAQYNTPENMASYLSTSFNLEKQAAEFVQPGSLFLIAESAGIPVGYTRLQVGTGGETCLTGQNPIELVRIYLLHAWTGKGYGNQLMQACLEMARERGCDTVWLGVWEENERAIRFYEKCGFKQVGTHSFLLGSDQQIDYIMEKKL